MKANVFRGVNDFGIQEVERPRAEERVIAAQNVALGPRGLRVGPEPLASAVLSRVTVGSPVKLTEVMQARYYTSGGKSWLGLRSVSTGEAIQPLAGPLADSTAGVRGLTLRYLNGVDAPTSDPASVRAIEVALVGVTDQPIHGRDLRPRVDSFPLTTRVALRNGIRP